MQLTKTIFNERHCYITYVGKVMQVSTHMTQGRVLRLRPLDLLRWMLTMNSTVLSDGPGLKHFNFEFFTVHANLSSRMQQDDGLQSFFRLIGSIQPSSRLAKKPISKHLQNLKYRT